MKGCRFQAALAGAKWEVVFLGGDGEVPGLRLTAQAFDDVLPRFAKAFCKLVAQHRGDDAATRDERDLLWASVSKSQHAAQVLLLLGAGAGDHDDDDDDDPAATPTQRANANALPAAVLAALDLPPAQRFEKAQPPRDKADKADARAAAGDIITVPSPAFSRRPVWSGAVEQNICAASGVPSLLGICGERRA